MHTLIEELRLHPITCVTSLNHQQKKDLIGRNIITCADLVKRPEILKDIGVRVEGDAQRAVEEAKLIMGSGR
jgi:hypothetical protein